MKTVKLLIVCFALLASFVNPSSVLGAPLPFSVRVVDPTIVIGGRPRTPVQIPEVDLSGYTLTFYDSCVGCTLRIVNLEDEVEYTTVITSDTLVLPSTLEGQYELQIIRDNWCFYGDIEL